MGLHNPPDTVLTKTAVLREAARLRVYYRKRRGQKPGLWPSNAVYILIAARALVKMNSPKKKAIFTTEVMEFLYTNSPETRGYDLANLYRSRGYKEIIWEAAWAGLREGQRVYNLVKCEGPISPREIQRRLTINKERMNGLPRPGAILISNGRPTKLSVPKY
jgi:hypothetical protein